MSAPSATRPTGITILAVLAGLSAVGGLFSGFVVFGAGATIFGGAGAVLGLALLALAGLSLALAWGFWTMAPWAWPLGVVLAAANIVVAIVGVIGGAGITGAIVPVVVSAAILYYLNQPTIKSLFGRA
jgi:hypothetical protein